MFSYGCLEHLEVHQKQEDDLPSQQYNIRSGTKYLPKCGIILDGLFACLLILLLSGVYTHLLVTMAVDNTQILNFTCLNDENYSLWVVYMEADLISCSVAYGHDQGFSKK
jgi:hypothetical protein